MLRQEMTNIVLIGMPGCGKTTVGQALARISGREAIDLDACIVEKAGCSIPEIFARDGEAVFRALEREVTAEVGKLSGKIILTGGGVVKDMRNYAPLHQNGRIYHLMRALDTLPTDGRPLSQTTALTALWEERKALYEAFRDEVIDNNGAVEDTAAAIWRDFCENSGA
jgi:shikimate dehydrogenase